MTSAAEETLIDPTSMVLRSAALVAVVNQACLLDYLPFLNNSALFVVIHR